MRTSSQNRQFLKIPEPSRTKSGEAQEIFGGADRAAVKRHELVTPAADIARKPGIAEQPFYRWKKQ
jgi:hypothetical protein